MEVNGSKNVEVKKPKSSFFEDFKAGPVGFEPTTFSLEG